MPSRVVRASCCALTPTLLLVCMQVFNVLTGQLVKELRQGHYEQVNACCYSPIMEALYSAGSDGAIVTWEPRRSTSGGEDTEAWAQHSLTTVPTGAQDDGDRDAWSDDF